MITGIFTLLGVVIGFLLSNYRKRTENPAETILERKDIGKKQKLAEPFVIRTDEYEQEKEEIKKREEKESDISLQSFLENEN